MLVVAVVGNTRQATQGHTHHAHSCALALPQLAACRTLNKKVAITEVGEDLGKIAVTLLEDTTGGSSAPAAAKVAEAPAAPAAAAPAAAAGDGEVYWAGETKPAEVRGWWRVGGGGAC